MRFRTINNLAGWIVCLIAFAVYACTLEPTTSLWDCGEFISAAYKLQIPHPPGAPLFILLGRFFVILFGDNPQTAAIAVNTLSAVASAFTILFLFWSITHFARKLVLLQGVEPQGRQVFTIISAGTIGALAYAFSDSFWFSAVEGEVYALSSFFTALVFWAALKWEQQADQPGADRWLVFLFFMMGVSIGVHLLNLLTIPAIIMIYYFKRFRVTRKGTLLAFIVACAITGVVQKFIIQSTIRGAGWFDIQFVNELGLPFFSGFITFFILLTGALLLAVRYASRKQWYRLKLGLVCSLFMLLGYSTYTTTLLRSNANPGVDFNNVDNPITLASYLGREQYNDWPILYGPDFTEKAPYAANGDQYVKLGNRYAVAGKDFRQDWAAAPGAHFFPRLWDPGNDRRQPECYQRFTGLEEGEAPTMADNIRYFSNYQAGWMYMRYFLWNFSGKQNDLQGFGNARDSNFITGFSFVDNALHGDQSMLPDSIHQDNKGYNRLYMLPLALGIIGLVFHFRRQKKDFLVSGLLFFFTGLAVVVYLNQSGFQPRERDYAYVGSFYAFAIWIGLGVVALSQWLGKWAKGSLPVYAIAGCCLLAVPGLMLQQEWDDHDRSDKTLARDLARNYLESCPPNAILLTAEDNDTYPLWYLQEVEGVRRDVRVMISGILSMDWYINQLRYKVNDSDPFAMPLTPEQIAGNRLNLVYPAKLPGFDANKYYDLREMLTNVAASDDPRYTHLTEEGELIHLLPTRKFSVPVDEHLVRTNGTVQPGETILPQLTIDLSNKEYFLKNDLAILALIADNKWKRPICFSSSSTAADLGLEKYVRLEGLTWRLAPVENSLVNTAVASKNILEKFSYGNAGRPGVYFDEENRRRLNTIRIAHLQVAQGLLHTGDKAGARAILRRFDSQVSPANFPYGYTTNLGNQHNIVSAQFLQTCYLADDLELARKVTTSLEKDLRQQLRYYRHLGDAEQPEEQLVQNAYQLVQGKPGELASRQYAFARDILSSWQLLQQLKDWELEFTGKKSS
ncbi:MAG: DUF2723 domain-containing protein [Candidatus Pseudobacter hemicellulosilyticus]|uniref:DUF2723 domain-containing protein n=1 Tax=Candidatus Pseudobacter hemicellulosilyticus TaxID=3121375 RepID=A0AAJ6BI66_9BACT|nr:MAG: DUF2723 domain-containing protein [Pseudobacter sp.]